MDDGFIEERSSNIEEDPSHEYMYAQDLRLMPLIIEEVGSTFPQIVSVSTLQYLLYKHFGITRVGMRAGSGLK